MADLVDPISGAIVSELLKFVMAEVKKVKAFKSLFKELESTMRDLLPIILKIESLQKELDRDMEELKKMMETTKRAEMVVEKCSRVRWFHIRNKAKYTEEIKGINKDMLKFCQIDLQFHQRRDQLESLRMIGNVADSVHGLSKRMEETCLLSSVPSTVSKDLCSVPKLNKEPVGLDWPLMELKKKLLDDSIHSLVVSAPPGCGKTTLVTHLCHDAEVQGKFEHIFFSVVSSTPNFKVIVQHLLQHNGEGPVTYENDLQALVGLTNMLEKLKEKGSILLVLDDVWQGAESLLENFRISIPNYKILVTSRFDLPDFDYTYPLKPLEDKAAKALLIRCASRPLGHVSSYEYEDLLQKILKRCNGFPLVIKVVGASLKDRSLTTWEGQVKSWSEGDTVLDNPLPTTVLERLQPSFKFLDFSLKHCFLDMGLFLEDQKIRASTIIDIWVKLYGKSSIVCMKYLEDLAAQNLLDLVPLGSNKQEDGFYNECLVTQHDILRELAIRQSKSVKHQTKERLNLEIRDDKFPDWCLEQPISARLLSIYTDDAFTSTWIEMDCPNVEALVLNISSSHYALPEFIARMNKLKVLTITNHGFFPTRLRNFSCLSLLPNLKRIRFEKVSVHSLDIHQLRLGNLEKLSLVMCSFGGVFYEVEEQDHSIEALPRLEEIDIDYCYDLDELPYWIYEVASLKRLSITNCYKLSSLPEAIGNLSKLEVLRLCSCINLSELPETMERLSNLRSLDISHCLGLRKLPLEIGKLQKLKKISMNKCWRCELPDSVKNLENVEVKCDEETGLIWEKFKPKMRNLSVLEEEPEHNLNLLQMF